MQANPFESQLERLARTLTEQFGVAVICQGENAWTDGRQIVLPSVPEPMDEGLERMMVGYLDHEMAHVAFSDFKVVEQFVKRHPGFESLLNVVEDALIERRAMQRWPGVRRNLDSMFQQIRSRLVKLIAQRGPFDRFCTAVYLKLAHYQDIVGLDREVAGYEDLLDQFPQVRETKDAGRLAEALLNRWLKRQGSQPKPPPQTGGQAKQRAGQKERAADGSGSSDGAQEQQQPSSNPSPVRKEPTGQSGAAQQDRSGQPDSDTDQDNDPPGTKGQEQPGGPDAGTEQDGSCDGSSSGSNEAGEAQAQSDASQAGDIDMPSNQVDEGQADDENASSQVGGSASAEQDQPQAPGRVRGSGQGGTLIGDVIREAIAECIRQLDGCREYRVYTKRYDWIDVVPDADDREVQALLQSGVDTVRRLRRGLTSALRSAEKRWWRDEQLRGELSQRTLYRLCMDRPRLDIFRIRSTVQGKSTAVSIVLDASGSMHTRKMDTARRAVRVLLEALADLRIATEAFTFTTGDRVDIHRVLQETGTEASKLRERYGRLSNLEIGLIKRFEDPVKPALQRLPSIHGTGLTPLGEAMQIGAARLVPRPETRKILLVLTDGKAGCDGGGEAAVTHARHIAELIGEAGMELVGVGIQDDSVRTIVNDSIVIQSLEELPAQLCKLLGRTLKRGVQHDG